LRLVEAGGDAVEAGSYPLLSLPTLSSSRTGPLPAEHIEATGVKRRKYGDAGRVIKLRSNHVEVKLDQGTLYYDGMYLSYSWEDKWLKNVCHDPVSQEMQLFDLVEHRSTADGCLS
jgi:hypothetical protein